MATLTATTGDDRMHAATPNHEPTGLSTTERLVLLCWDGDAGKVTDACSMGIHHGVGGALLVDALLAGQIDIEDERAAVTGGSTDDDLLQAVVTRIQDARKPPKVDNLLFSLASTANLESVRDRLVGRELLAPVEDRVLGIFPRTRYPAIDPDVIESARRPVRDLLTGVADPQSADPLDVMVAAFAEPVGAIALLIDGPREREAATQRAEAFANGHGIPTAVADAAAGAQAALIAAISAAAVAATTTASSSSSGSC